MQIELKKKITLIHDKAQEVWAIDDSYYYDEKEKKVKVCYYMFDTLPELIAHHNDQFVKSSQHHLTVMKGLQECLMLTNEKLLAEQEAISSKQIDSILGSQGTPVQENPQS